jgi:hypothetical protein
MAVRAGCVPCANSDKASCFVLGLLQKNMAKNRLQCAVMDTQGVNFYIVQVK